MFARTLKTTAIAAVAVLVTAGASMAAQYAWVDQGSNVRFKPKHVAKVVNYIHEGQKVKVVAHQGNWVKVQIPGKDGWVKAGVLDYSPFPNNHPWPHQGQGQICFNGQYGYLCIGN